MILIFHIDRDHTRRSDPGHRPASIVELADRALKNPWDPSKDLRFWMKAAANHRLAGKSHAETGNLEGAFVEYAQAATLILEKLPSHPEYWSSLNAEQRHNLGLVSFINDVSVHTFIVLSCDGIEWSGNLR